MSFEITFLILPLSLSSPFYFPSFSINPKSAFGLIESARPVSARWIAPTLWKVRKSFRLLPFEPRRPSRSSPPSLFTLPLPPSTPVPHFSGHITGLPLDPSLLLFQSNAEACAQHVIFNWKFNGNHFCWEFLNNHARKVKNVLQPPETIFACQPDWLGRVASLFELWPIYTCPIVRPVHHALWRNHACPEGPTQRPKAWQRAA